MAKMTIYVPDDLKRRMDEFDGVNWSPLAYHAFESEVDRTHQSRGELKTMDDVITRLRASESPCSPDPITNPRADEHGRSKIGPENNAEPCDIELLSGPHRRSWFGARPILSTRA